MVAILRDAITNNGLAVSARTRWIIVAVYASGAAYEVEFTRPVAGNTTMPAEAFVTI